MGENENHNKIIKLVVKYVFLAASLTTFIILFVKSLLNLESARYYYSFGLIIAYHLGAFLFMLITVFGFIFSKTAMNILFKIGRIFNYLSYKTDGLDNRNSFGYGCACFFLNLFLLVGSLIFLAILLVK